jgi:hypothetical protein
MNTNTLIIISSKYPNPTLYTCIEQLYKLQIGPDTESYKICVIDSDSSDFSNYTKISEDFPDVDIQFIKNKNYEYGAWKYASQIYPNYNIYFCLQDSCVIQHKIDLSIINNVTAYTSHNHSGFSTHTQIKEKCIEILKESGLDYPSIVDTNFNLSCENMFIVNNVVIKDIFNTLTIAPIDKDDSCRYERIFGIYFILKQINTVDFMNSFIKHHLQRL